VGSKAILPAELPDRTFFRVLALSERRCWRKRSGLRGENRRKAKNNDTALIVPKHRAIAEIPGHTRTTTGELMPKSSSDSAKTEKEKQPGGLIRKQKPASK
jgi:hypothetical protein